MIPTSRFEKVEFASLDELADWLAANHGREEGVWLVRYKKNVPAKFIDRLAVIDVLLRFGWVDGIARRLDEQRTMQLISPRRQQAWAQSYKDRAAALDAQGLLEAPGRAAIERAREAGLWDAYADVDALAVPPDLRAALALTPQAEAFFDASAPSYRRNLLRWVHAAGRERTRAARIAEIVARSARRERIAQM